MIELNKIHLGDCLQVMQSIDDKSIDMILCDLPYNITQNQWDKMIPLDKLWEQYERIIKDHGAIVLTASQPFTSILIMSNLKLFRYEWIWVKNKSTGFLNAKKIPLKNHESILVFYKKTPNYFPQKTTGHKPVNSYTKNTSDGNNYGETKKHIKGGGQTDRYPQTVIYFDVVNNDNSNNDKYHSTQKPVSLFEYIIKTYSKEGELVLDNTIGSGTTAIASLNTKRRFIGIEKEPDYVKIANKRIDDWKSQDIFAK